MQLNAVGIICSDIEASLGFYRMLGVPFDEFDAGVGHCEAQLAGGMKLMLDTEEVMASFIDGFETPKGNDRVSFAFECDSPAHVDEMYGVVTDAGFAGAREPFDAFWGQRTAAVEDPDGNEVYLYASL